MTETAGTEGQGTTPQDGATDGQQTQGQQGNKLEDLLAGVDDEARSAILSEVSRARSEAAKHRREAKANASAAERLAELEKQNLTEPEKIAEAQIRAIEAELQLNRYQVAAEKGLPADAAQFLYGDDVDEIAEAAEALDAFVVRRAQALGFTAPGTRPAGPDLKQGQRGTHAPVEDGNSWLRRAAGRA